MSLKNKVLSRLNSLNAISSPPPVLSEVLSLLGEENSSAKKLSDVILKDANLTARILRVANSSFYGCRKHISTVNQAVVVLGYNAVRGMVVSISVHNQFAAQNAGNEKDYSKYWRHFLESASAARHIAERFDKSQAEEAYIAGLLHDFGMLFLLQYFPQQTFQVKRLVSEGSFMLDAEREVFGVDHQEIGYIIASKWNMPEILAEVIGNHHPRDDGAIAELPLLSKITVLADNLSPSNFEVPGNLEAASQKIRTLENCCYHIGMGLEDITNVYKALPKEVLCRAEGLELDFGDAVEYLSQTNEELFNLYLDLANIFKERLELSGRLLTEERTEGTLESLHITLATLSHYINNATMSIGGQCEVLDLLYNRGDTDEIMRKIPETLRSIKNSVKKITMVLEELSGITNMETINYFKHSRAIDIEKSLKERLDKKAVEA